MLATTGQLVKPNKPSAKCMFIPKNNCHNIEVSEEEAMKKNMNI
jgi:hypothetical protein